MGEGYRDIIIGPTSIFNYRVISGVTSYFSLLKRYPSITVYNFHTKHYMPFPFVQGLLEFYVPLKVIQSGGLFCMPKNESMEKKNMVTSIEGIQYTYEENRCFENYE